jgi:hypothetical protein
VFLTLVIGRFHSLRQRRGILWLMLGDTPVTLAVLNIVRVMALGADEPALGTGTGPLTDTLAMNPFPPVPIDFTVALSAQLLWLVETDRLVTVID